MQIKYWLKWKSQVWMFRDMWKLVIKDSPSVLQGRKIWRSALFKSGWKTSWNMSSTTLSRFGIIDFLKLPERQNKCFLDSLFQMGMIDKKMKSCICIKMFNLNLTQHIKTFEHVVSTCTFEQKQMNILWSPKPPCYSSNFEVLKTIHVICIRKASKFSYEICF